MKTLPTTVLLAALLFLSACAADDTGGVVARADDHELTVNETVRLLASATDVPNQPQVVVALADLWIDYTLLAEATARDSTLSGVDMSPLLDQQFDQEMVQALQDSVIQPDTVVTEAELRNKYDTDTPGARVRARHILMGFPQQATQEQRDSVRRRMDSVLTRVRAGEDFAALARQYSQDAGTAQNGGDLDWFERGQMVKPFDDAAFSLDPGEVSGIVESPFGLHIIKVEDKEIPSFEDVRADFESQIKQQRYQQAESTYIAGVENDADMEVQDGAEALVKDLAQDPGQQLGSRAAKRALVTYGGGKYTLGDLQAFLRTRQPQFIQGLQTAPDDVIRDNFLRALTQRKLLVQVARAAGLGPSEARRDSLAGEYRTRFREAARSAGLFPIEVKGTETRAQAVERVVQENLQGIVAGTRQILPTTGISVVLRSEYDARTFDAGVDAAVQAITRVRGPQPTQPAPSGQQAAPGANPPVTPPDTSGGS